MSTPQRERPPRTRLAPTAAGWVVLAACLVLVLLVGAAEGRSAAGLLGALFAAAAIVGAPLARWNLAGLAVSRARGRTALVGEGFDLALSVANRGRVGARDVTVHVGPDARRRPGGLLAHLGPRSPGEVRAWHRVLRRGRHDEVTVTLASTFPLGLFTARSTWAVPTELWILPRPVRLAEVPEPGAARTDRDTGLRLNACGQEEFRKLRERRPGEGLRRVHWPLSVRRRRTLLREFEAEAPPPVRVWLSRFVSGRSTDPMRRRAFERAVTLAASLLDHLSRRGIRAGLVIAGPDRVALPPARGRAALLPALLALAEVQPVFAAVAEEVAPEPEHTIVVLAGGGRARPADHGVPVDAFLELDVDRPDSDALFVRGSDGEEAIHIGKQPSRAAASRRPIRGRSG